MIHDNSTLSMPGLKVKTKDLAFYPFLIEGQLSQVYRKTFDDCRLLANNIKFKRVENQGKKFIATDGLEEHPWE